MHEFLLLSIDLYIARFSIFLSITIYLLHLYYITISPLNIKYYVILRYSIFNLVNEFISKRPMTLSFSLFLSLFLYLSLSLYLFPLPNLSTVTLSPHLNSV